MTKATWLFELLIPFSHSSFPGNLFHVFNKCSCLVPPVSIYRLIMPLVFYLGLENAFSSTFLLFSNSTPHLFFQPFNHSHSSFNQASKTVLFQSPFLIFGIPNGYFPVLNFLDLWATPLTIPSVLTSPLPLSLLCHKSFCLVIFLLLWQMLPLCFICRLLILCLLLKQWDVALLSLHILSLKRSHLFHGFISHLYEDATSLSPTQLSPLSSRPIFPTVRCTSVPSVSNRHLNSTFQVIIFSTYSVTSVLHQWKVPPCA